MRRFYPIFIIIVFYLSFSTIAEKEFNIDATVTINPVEGVLRVFPEYFFIKAAPDSVVEKDLLFWQENGITALDVSLSSEGEIEDWISFSEDEFILYPLENKTIVVFIEVPVELGIYTGEIYVEADDTQIIIPVEIEVTDEYEIDVDVDVTSRIVRVGDDVNALITLRKEGVEGTITCDMEYKVSRIFGETIVTVDDGMSVTDSAEKIIAIPIPDDARPGLYILDVKTTHLDKKATDWDFFLVRRGRSWWSIFGF